MAARGLAIRADVATATELRRLAKKEPRRRTAQRMLAIANALEGMSRAEAARAAGIERQALRDAVVRFNAEGLAGLIDRPHGRRPERLADYEAVVEACCAAWNALTAETGRLRSLTAYPYLQQVNP